MSNLKTERKQYTVTGFNFKEISRGKGSIEYQLMDEFGNERTVKAMAKLNLFKKISAVRPIYHRELPLVEALAQTALNDSVVVDFTTFNKSNPRGSTRKQKVTVPTIKVKNSSAPIYDVGSLIDNKYRLLQLTVFTVAVFIVIAYLLSKVPSPAS